MTGDLTWKYNSTTTCGDDTPNYKKRLQSGKLIPMTGFQQFELTGESECSWDIQYTSTLWTQQCNWAPLTTDIPDYAELVSAVNLDPYFVQAAAAKIYSSGFDAGTFLAEFGQIVELIANAAKKLIRLIQDPNAWEALLKVGANLWLEVRYGWRTLVYDLQNISKLIATFGSSRERHSERVGMSYSDTNFSSSAAALGGAGTYNLDVTDEVTVSSLGRVIADITPPEIMLNPMITAWEKIKLSFVVDWFLNIGQSLYALNFLLFSSDHKAAMGCLVTVDRQVTASNWTLNTGWAGSFSGSASFNAKLTIRQPTSVDAHPKWAVRLNWAKLIDIIALLTQTATNRGLRI
jgi:hypothetical protein